MNKKVLMFIARQEYIHDSFTINNMMIRCVTNKLIKRKIIFLKNIKS